MGQFTRGYLFQVPDTPTHTLHAGKAGHDRSMKAAFPSFQAADRRCI